MLCQKINLMQCINRQLTRANSLFANYAVAKIRIFFGCKQNNRFVLPSLPIHQHLHLATNVSSKNTTSGIFLQLSNRSLLIMLGDATDIYF